MGKVKLEFPDKVVFTTNITVQIGDINYGGHVANDAYLKIAHEARLRFLENYGWSELDMKGASLIMSDSVIRYLGEIFRGDNIRVEIAIADITNISFDLYYRFMVHDKVTAIIKTGLLFFNYESRKICKGDKSVIEKLNELTQ